MSLISLTVTISNHQQDALPLQAKREDIVLMTQRFALSKDRQSDLINNIIKLVESYRSSVSPRDIDG